MEIADPKWEVDFYADRLNKRRNRRTTCRHSKTEIQMEK